VPTQFDVDVRGEITSDDVSVLRAGRPEGLFRDVVPDQVSYVNAPVLAQERGVDVRLLTDPMSEEFRNVHHAARDARGRDPGLGGGTLTGQKQVEKLVGIDGPRSLSVRWRSTCWCCATPTGPA
jgi:D-3-phosphoglycerate dehydrogenase